MKLLPDPSFHASLGPADFRSLSPEAWGTSGPSPGSSVPSNRLRASPPGTGSSDFYSEHIGLCLGKGMKYTSLQGERHGG